MRQRLYQILIAGLLLLSSCTIKSGRSIIEYNDQEELNDCYTFIDSYVDDSTLTWNFRFSRSSDTILIKTLSSSKPVNWEVMLIDSSESNKLRLDYNLFEFHNSYIGSATSFEQYITTSRCEIWNLETRTKLKTFDYKKFIISKSIYHGANNLESTDTACIYEYSVSLQSKNEILINNYKIYDSSFSNLLPKDLREGFSPLE